MSDWHPPETAPRDGSVFLITTAGPNVDLCCWVEERGCFQDYFYKQKIEPKWPYMVGWKAVGRPARICNSEAESRLQNGWTGDETYGVFVHRPPRNRA